MMKSNIKFLTDQVEVEDPSRDVIEEAQDSTRLATLRVPLQRKDLNGYESKMRLHAERCVAGR